MNQQQGRGIDEFASIPPDHRRLTRAELDAAAAGAGAGMPQMHSARAEILRRDREDAEGQEQSRRDFERTLTDKQLAAASAVAWATKLAAFAAVASAVGAMGQLVIAALK